MNEPNSQHNKSRLPDSAREAGYVDVLENKPVDVKQDTETMLAKVQDLLRDAYTSGYRAGYHKGFEFGVATVTDRKAS